MRCLKPRRPVLPQGGFAAADRYAVCALLAVLGFAGASAGAADALTAASAADDDADLPIPVMVSSVSRRSEPLQQAAAAVFVITAQDIQRAGAASLPEALRLAPGVEVAQLAGGRWAVSVRGFNSRFSNKLLVLLDGRSLYTSLFSGVYWEALPVPVSEIERVEVVRGPGAALWGANAVNGVINILTKRARDTVGGGLSLHLGTHDEAAIGMRQSGAPDADSQGRVWAQLQRGTSTELPLGADAKDAPHDLGVGFRYDHQAGAGASLQLTGSASTHRSADNYPLPLLGPPGAAGISTPQEISQGYLNGTFTRVAESGREDTLQVSGSQQSFQENGVLRDLRLTMDLGLRSELNATPDQMLVYGLDYRMTRDGIDTPSPLLQISSHSATQNLSSLFVHDEITLVPACWALSVGASLERTSDTGFELQPDLRLLWSPSRDTSAWATLSSAVRTPSRGERDAQLNLGTVLTPGPGGPTAVTLLLLGNPDLRSERVRALELGLRRRLGPALAVDGSVFFNRYDDLVGSALGLADTVPLAGANAYQANVHRVSTLAASTLGAELALDWQVAMDTRVQLNYSYVDVQAEAASDPLSLAQQVSLAGSAAHHRASLRLSQDLDPRDRLDAWLRYVGALDSQQVSAYMTLDLRYALEWSRSLSLALIGKNLLAPRHTEFNAELGANRGAAIPRVIGVTADWRY